MYKNSTVSTDTIEMISDLLSAEFKPSIIKCYAKVWNTPDLTLSREIDFTFGKLIEHLKNSDEATCIASYDFLKELLHSGPWAEFPNEIAHNSTLTAYLTKVKLLYTGNQEGIMKRERASSRTFAEAKGNCYKILNEIDSSAENYIKTTIELLKKQLEENSLDTPWFDLEICLNNLANKKAVDLSSIYNEDLKEELEKLKKLIF